MTNGCRRIGEREGEWEIVAETNSENLALG